MSGSLGMGLMGLGTILSGVGKISEGNAALAGAQSKQQALDYSAGILNQKATQALAAGTSQAAIDRLNTQYVLSSQRANAAASGFSATSTTPVSIMGQTSARGEYDALNAIYSGQEQALGYQNQAALDVYMGQQELQSGQYQQRAGLVSGITSILSGAGNVAAKYGSAGGPSGGGSGSYDYGSGV